MSTPLSSPSRKHVCRRFAAHLHEPPQVSLQGGLPKMTTRDHSLMPELPEPVVPESVLPAIRTQGERTAEIRSRFF
jgi:hypothetical protein